MFVRYLAARPDDDSARLLLGLSRQLSGNVAAAEVEFQGVVQRRPKDARARFFLARSLLLNGKFSKAAESPKSAGMLGEPPSRVDNLLGSIYEEQGLLPEALNSYIRAIQANPEFAEALVNQGKLLLKLKRPAEAADALRKALEVQPQLGEAMYHLARAEVERGNLVESRNHAARA